MTRSKENNKGSVSTGAAIRVAAVRINPRIKILSKVRTDFQHGIGEEEFVVVEAAVEGTTVDCLVQ